MSLLWSADFVYYAIKCKLIKMSNILKQYKASTVLNVEKFQMFINDVYNLLEMLSMLLIHFWNIWT